MPYTEDCSRQSGKWIGCKVSSGKCDCKTTVLHTDFDCKCGCLVIFHMEEASGKQSESHTRKVMKDNDTKYEESGCNNLFCIYCDNSADDHDD